MSWSLRHKLLYGGAVVIVALAVVIWLGYSLFSTPPSCFDGKQDQGEQGIDCGGPCAKLCPSEVRAPIVLWSRSFEVSTSTYTAAAYIENPNSSAGAYNVPYTFRLYDSNNELIIEQDGTFNIPPQQNVAVVVPNINVGYRTPVQTFFEFGGAITWMTIPAAEVPVINVQGQQLSSDGTHLSATVTNESNIDAPQLTLDAVLFDASSTAQAASQSVLVDLPAYASQQVVFTWPQPISGIVEEDITSMPTLPPEQQ